MKRKDGMDVAAISRAVYDIAHEIPMKEWLRMTGERFPGPFNRLTRKRARPNRKVPTHKGNRK